MKLLTAIKKAKEKAEKSNGEEELSELSPEDKQEMLEGLGCF